MLNIETYNFAGKKALVRVDFNVPLDKNTFAVTDLTRLKAHVPTIRKILQEGGSAILMSHLGRPKGGYEEKYSLKHIIPTLEKLLGQKVLFATDCIGNDAQEMAKKLQAGEVLLLENVRFYAEEEKGDEGFAQKLASLGDVYVNDAFGTAHRKHASTAVIAQFMNEKMAGFVMKTELDNAQKVLENAERPFTAIMGGAKISDKILIIERLLEKVDNLLIGGGMSYTFFKALGGEIGSSLVEADKLDLAKKLLEKAKNKGVNLVLPQDSVIADAFNNEANRQEADNMHIPAGWMGLDIGTKAIEQFSELIKQSKTILWNGPVGVFEMSNFAQGTAAVAQAIADATAKGAFSLIGGGDSAAAVNQLGFGEQVSYISTGGGALLEYIEGKELPGVKALES
ncbi:MAG: phosphoglycerate kinase [Raineya sp.]|nr:phosphoglycerate kinase [Raineya sp.]MDW8296798.1 phosphoglycerate kinase [Raineya sp.]